MRQIFFFNKVTGLRPSTLLKKGPWQRCLPGKFEKFLRTPFYKEQFRWLLLFCLPYGGQMKYKSFIYRWDGCMKFSPYQDLWHTLKLLHRERHWRNIRRFSGPYFPAFGQNTEWYGVSLHIQSGCGKIRIKKLRIRTLFTQWWRHCFTYLKQFQSADWRLKHLLTGFLQKSEILTSICRNTRLFKNKPLWNILKWFSAKNERPMTTLMFCQ